MSTKKKSRKASEEEEVSEANNPTLTNPILKECDELIKWLLSKPESEPFSAPVDWRAYGLYDYPEIIKKPMDLGTIQTKLKDGKYPNHEKFAADVRLVWRNAMTYNRPDSDIYVTADKLSKVFERKYAKILKKHQAPQPQQQATGKRKRGEAKSADVPAVSRADRLKLSQLVNQLSSDELGQMVDMIQRDAPQALSEDNEKIDIEINLIDPTTLLNLIDFAQQCASKKRKTSSSS